MIVKLDRNSNLSACFILYVVISSRLPLIVQVAVMYQMGNPTTLPGVFTKNYYEICCRNDMSYKFVDQKKHPYLGKIIEPQCWLKGQIHMFSVKIM